MMSDAIYSLVSCEKLQDILATASDCFELPIQLLNERGDVLQQHGRTLTYCGLLQRHVFPADECARIHSVASERAYALGESYIFDCHAHLSHIVFPLVSQHTLLGTVLLGPFLMEPSDDSFLQDVIERDALPDTLCAALAEQVRAVPLLSPGKAGQVSRLVQHLFAPLLTDEKLLMREKQEKLYQQSRINETIQMFKGSARAPGGYPYEKERALMAKVKTCDIQAAKALVNDMLGYVLLVRGQDIEVIRSRALELTTLLSRVAIEGGAPADHMVNLNHQYIARLRQLDQYEALCYQLQEIVEAFILSITLPTADAGNAPIREAIQHIAVHYSEPLTLVDVAGLSGLSPSYFSSLFKRAMGIHYQEYLSRVRIEEAKYLLSATDYPLSQIAVSVGYSDQSSFSKAFKRVTGLTPNQYR